MKRLTLLLIAFAAAALVASVAQAQDRKDRVFVILRGAATPKPGTVLSETWKGVELDTDGDGRADVTYPPEQVNRVDYAKVPQWLLEARLLKSRPKELIDKLLRAYNDDATPKKILQHAYYDIASAYAAEAMTDPAALPKAVDAFDKLFAKVPDTCYAVTGRIELGNLMLALGKPDQAVGPFKELADGPYGPEVSRQGQMLTVRCQLASGRYEDAERALTKLAETPKMDAGLLQEINLLKCRSLVGQNKLDDAWKRLGQALGQNPGPKALAVAYSVMGDYFAAKGDPRSALIAYLKVPLMYGSADPVEKAQAVREAGNMLKKLNRAKEIETLNNVAGQ